VKDAAIYLRHIRDALARIEKYTALRNVLIHEYFGVDIEIVWRVVERRLPTLKRHVATMLAE
jgi:uncharacterized protein with HEPN domain